jgi:hypothetical protein
MINQNKKMFIMKLYQFRKNIIISSIKYFKYLKKNISLIL